MIELAVVLPVLLLIVFGIIYFSEFLNYSTDETHLAAEAVRWAAVNVNPGSSTLQQYVLSQATPGLQTASTDVTSPAKVYLYFPSGSSGQIGSPVRACVTASVHFLPFLGLSDTTITQTATMRLEQTPSWSVDSPPAQCSTS